MISTGKLIDINLRNTFIIPIKWRREFKITEGKDVEFRITKGQIFVRRNTEHTLDITGTVGKSGNIYIPKEICKYFNDKGLNQFEIFADEENKAIVIKSTF